MKEINVEIYINWDNNGATVKFSDEEADKLLALWKEAQDTILQDVEEEDYWEKFDPWLQEKVPLDKDKVEPSKEYVYIGSYIYEQEEPLALPGLVFDPEYAEDGEVLAECMFTSDFEDEKLKREYMSNGNDEEWEKDTPAL